MKKIILFALIALSFSTVRADEGMWMLPLIEKLNIQKMQGLGCVLTAEEIYSEENISLKDAVVIFGNGCTGVMVSPQGLVFTNHHCGYSAIQELSSVEHNYLRDGYTAKNVTDELPAQGLTVTFLNRIEDITEKVLAQIPADLTGEARATLQDSICKDIVNAYTTDTTNHFQELSLKAVVKSYFANNQFYLIVYQVFNDVRFAFSPGSSIGKFGGDTDNWMWPRHTGDFSVFRVYSDKNGVPAPYAADNVPYSPKRFAKISLKGYQAGDFTMILGNPGSTDRYASSFDIENMMNGENQARIDVRGAKQEVWKSYMTQSEAIQLAYASKYAQSSNYWKNSIGMNKAIRKLGIVERKKEEEKLFQQWANATPERKASYGNVLNVLEQAGTQSFADARASDYLYEALLSGVEIPRISANVYRLAGTKDLSREEFLRKVEKLYENYYPEVDKATFVTMLQTYKNYVDAAYLPDIYSFINKKFKGNYNKYVDYIFEKSAFSSFQKFKNALNNKKFDLEKDPAYQYYSSIREKYFAIYDHSKEALTQIDDAQRLYQAGLLEIAAEQGKAMYPNANFTMRLTYGTVGGYSPADATEYQYYTTTDGVLQKEIPNDYEFDVPSNLKQAIEHKDFAKYTDPKTGKMHVCFLSNNDITGGNSGSPIFNGNGELIGLAFDGNWEAMSGDIVFEPELQRTINVDIRYVLFIMDKVGDAQRLLSELETE
ncbi:MAG: S46 family peptidase [Prevotellaceae bacterium]|nr:S46 family peptidase [Prevotellaceae bacterium]